MKLLSPFIISLAAPVFLAACASAQCAIAPPDVLNNTNWAFHWEASDYVDGSSNLRVVGTSAGIGTMSFARTAQDLNVTGGMTINADNRVVRLSTSGGKVQYQCDNGTSLLRGGTLQFSDGRDGILWQFIFATSAYNEIYMINEFYMDNIFLSKILKGNAVKIDSLASCPASPATVLEQTNGWSIKTQTSGYNYATDGNFYSQGTTAAGYLNFRSSGDPRNAGPSLSGVITANHGSDVPNGGLPALPANAVVRLADTNGRYQVYSGCGGGNMSLMVGLLEVQYEFVFAAGDYSRAFLLSTVATGTGSALGTSRAFGGPKSDILNGVLRKF